MAEPTVTKLYMLVMFNEPAKCKAAPINQSVKVATAAAIPSFPTVLNNCTVELLANLLNASMLKIAGTTLMNEEIRREGTRICW